MLWTQKLKGKRGQLREQHLQLQQWGRTGWFGDLLVLLVLSQDRKQDLINMLRFVGLYACTYVCLYTVSWPGRAAITPELPST